MATVTYKVCTKCGLDKPSSEYYSHSQNKSGLQPKCKPCLLETQTQWRLANIEQVRKQKREAYIKIKDDPAFKAKLKADTLARKDYKREYDREYRRRNPELQNSRAKAWRENNPELRRVVVKSYKARRRAQTDGGVSSSNLAAWVKDQKKVCYWCGIKCAKDYHIDHYVPLSKGGAHELHNLVIACPKCNLTKNAKDPIEFAREVGRLL